MNIRNDKKEFITQLNEVTPNLPAFYSVLLQKKFPNIDRTKFYSVKAGKTVNWDILNAMKELVNENIN